MNDKQSKLSLSDIERHLWGAAHIITGPIDASDYKTYIFPILFFKRVCDVYDEEFEGSLDPRFIEKLAYDEIEGEDVELMKNPTYENVLKLGIKHSDAIVFATEYISDEIRSYAKASGKSILDAQPEENLMSVFDDFYSEVMASDSVMAE